MQFCGECGTKMEEDVIYCPECGKAVNAKEEPTLVEPTPAPAQAPSKTLSPKLLGIIGVAVVAVIVLVIVTTLSRGSKFDIRVGGVTATDGYTTFFIDSRGRIVEINDVTNYFASMCGAHFAAVTRHRDIYFISNGNSQRVADGIDGTHFVFSANGTAIAYRQDGTLMVWEARNDITRRVANDVITAGLHLSPDGRSVAFVVRDRDRDEGFISRNGRTPESIGRDAVPVGIANGARFVYYRQSERDRLYVRNNRGNSNRISSNFTAQSSVQFNRDLSEALFHDDGTYISVRGRDRERISRDEIHFIGPQNIQFARPGDGRSIIIGIQTFANNVFALENSIGWNWTIDLIYVDRNFETNTLAREVEHFEMSGDGQTIVILDNRERLYHITNISRPEPTFTRLGANLDFRNFVISGNAQQVYFVNSDGDLYFIRGTNSPVRVARDVYRGSIIMGPSRDTLFFIDDWSPRDRTGRLSTTRNGRTPSRVAGATEVSRIITDGFGIFYTTPSGGNRFDVFRSNGNASFSGVLSDVHFFSNWWLD